MDGTAVLMLPGIKIAHPAGFFKVCETIPCGTEFVPALQIAADRFSRRGWGSGAFRKGQSLNCAESKSARGGNSFCRTVHVPFRGTAKAIVTGQGQSEAT